MSVLDHHAVTRFDDAVDQWFAANLRGRPVFDRMFYALSAVGDWSLIWHVIGWTRAITHRRPTDGASLSIGLGLESALVNGFIKSRFRRARPATGSGTRPHRLRTPRTSSFPSGHASAAAFTATVLSRRAGKPALWWGLGGLVAVSRVHVRIHHASDVVGGAVIGALLGQVLGIPLSRAVEDRFG